MASLVLVVLAWISSTHPAVGAAAGTVVAWGGNGSGQTNVPALALTGVTAISTRFNTLALKEDGAVLTWGNNSPLLTNIPVAARSGVTAIAAGTMHSLVLKSDKTVVAWGYNLSGIATVPDAARSNATAVAAGNEHNVVLKEDGTVVVWGYDYGGQASVAAGLTGVVAIASGGIHTLALKNDGTVVAWGLNRGGQLDVPLGLTSVTAIAGGFFHSVALKSDGTVVAWGTNDSGQTSVPEGLTGVVAIAAGYRHTLALKDDGTIVGWGDNTYGQITIPAGLPKVLALAAGGDLSLAIVERPAIVTNGCLIAASPPDRIQYVPCNGWVFDDHGISVSNRCPDTATPPFEVQCQPPVGTWLEAGNHAIHCRVVAEGTVIADWGFPITVVKTNGPLMILCATNQITLFPSCDVSCVIVDYALPEVRGGALVQCTPPPGTCFSAPRGIGGSVVTPVTCRATNCGLYAECTFRIVVVQDPNQFRIPSFDYEPRTRFFTNHCGSDCVSTPYSLPTPFYGTLESCTPPPGACMPVGTNRIFCRATNVCRLSGGTFFNVVVVRGTGQLPSIIASDIVVTNCSTNCLIVDYPMPVVPPGASIRCNPPPGSCFPLGLTTVSCAASNECGTVGCEFPVTVQLDSRPLSISCPTNHIVVIQCESNCVPVNYQLPDVANGTLEQCTPPSGTCFPMGFNWVTCRATNDCGAISVCTFMVRIVATPPIIQCPSDISTFAPTCNSTSFCAQVTYPLPEVTGGTLIECTPPPGTCFPSYPPGSVTTHRVTCRATNHCGGSAECAFTIRVGGQAVGPRIQEPYTAWVTNHCGSNCVPAFYQLPPVANGTLLGCHPPPGTCLPVGTHEVYCRATNACASAEAFIVVRVVEGPTQPLISCPTNEMVVVVDCADSNLCKTVDYALPEVRGGTLIECIPPPGTCFPNPPGGVGSVVHPVTCRATNDCGGFAECSFSIRVIQGFYGPVLYGYPHSPIVVATNQCNAPCVPISYPVPSVGNGWLVGCQPPLGPCLPVGTHTIRCSARNACGTDSATFQVRVIEGSPQPPTIRIVHQDDDYFLFWEHECNTRLETSKEPDGPWEAIPAASSGYRVAPAERKQYFRVVVPD